MYTINLNQKVIILSSLFIRHRRIYHNWSECKLCIQPAASHCSTSPWYYSAAPPAWDFWPTVARWAMVPHQIGHSSAKSYNAHKTRVWTHRHLLMLLIASVGFYDHRKKSVYTPFTNFTEPCFVHSENKIYQMCRFLYPLCSDDVQRNELAVFTLY